MDSFSNIMLDMSQKHSILYAKCRNAIIAEYKGKAKGPNQGRKVIRNMLNVVIKELGGRYHAAKDINGKHFDAFVQFPDGSTAKFIKVEA